MIIEVCDLCKQNEPNKKFKVKISNKGFDIKNPRNHWYWKPYTRISICDICAEKLLGIKSNTTIAREIAKGKIPKKR